jgi:DNA polymerase-3 subunit epsilon
MRQVVLDTETTGLEPSQGHRIIEIGCVELIDRKLTGNHYHQYINPEREVEQGALEVHGITNEFLAEKPLIEHVVEDFIQYVSGAELVIHNAPFDVGFLNHELRLIAAKTGQDFGQIEDHCTILDTLEVARRKHPGQKNNLDALCKRYAVDNSQRDLHGALLDSEILADVYLLMTGGQASLSLADNDTTSTKAIQEVSKPLQRDGEPLVVIAATEAELSAHHKFMTDVVKAPDRYPDF